jgi:hypothetical protein
MPEVQILIFSPERTGSGNINKGKLSIDEHNSMTFNINNITLYMSLGNS